MTVTGVRAAPPWLNIMMAPGKSYIGKRKNAVSENTISCLGNVLGSITCSRNDGIRYHDWFAQSTSPTELDAEAHPLERRLMYWLVIILGAAQGVPGEITMEFWFSKERYCHFALEKFEQTPPRVNGVQLDITDN
jgi:hypothetical protein